MDHIAAAEVRNDRDSNREVRAARLRDQRAANRLLGIRRGPVRGQGDGHGNFRSSIGIVGQIITGACAAMATVN
jgi:hypothetical protein